MLTFSAHPMCRTLRNRHRSVGQEVFISGCYIRSYDFLMLRPKYANLNDPRVIGKDTNFYSTARIETC